MKWAEVSVCASSRADEAVANILIEEGAGGVAGVDSNGKAEVTTTLTAYYPVDDKLESRLNRIRARVRALGGFGLGSSRDRITVRQVHDQDWAEAWKAFFKPMVVGKLVVKPSWEEFEPSSGRIVLEIDPGMAFGTGSHPTTQLCLSLLQKRVRPGDLVLDVGTGSGILAIAAALLGADRVVALDVDPLAVKAAITNAERNGVSDRLSVFLGDSLGSVRFTPDIVVANILANTVVALAPAVARMLAEGGAYIASGIVSEREAEVVQAFRDVGLGIEEIVREGEWLAIVGAKP